MTISLAADNISFPLKKKDFLLSISVHCSSSFPHFAWLTFHQAGWLNQFTEGPDEPAQKKRQEDDQEQ